MAEPWWKRPLRVIQTNLQVRDTAGMDPERIARQIEEMGGNALVTNVGGIYAWYPSRVPFHHVNEHLPAETDLLRALIDACHARGIHLIARFDFSKADDAVYLQRPWWFTRDAEDRTTTVGANRFGGWSQLLTTCINEGYRNEDVAVKVLTEVLEGYDIDGIFFNAPHYSYCQCRTCREKYRGLFGADLPVDKADFHPEWESICLRDNIGRLNRAIKACRENVPTILYYNLYRDQLEHRIETADMICTEPQDVLSLGWRDIPQFWKPALAIKMGNTPVKYPRPFGIIHSCPGMEWRHTGLPPAEYRFWMSQVPANGGQIWHSITGYPDTITDKRILEEVSRVNHWIMKAEPVMEGAKSAAQIVLLWNAKASAEGIAEGLIDAQIQFDLLDWYQVSEARLMPYLLAILPEGYPVTDGVVAALTAFVQKGGRLLVEGADVEGLEALKGLTGIEGTVYGSEEMVAAYVRIEGRTLGTGFERTPLLPLRGRVAYCAAGKGSKVEATLVPPFAPLEAVGAPPERASLPAERTEIPLAIGSEHGAGRTMVVPFQLGMMVREYKLGEHTVFLRNVVDALMEGQRAFVMGPMRGVQAMAYRTKRGVAVHLVNGVGQRPLAVTTGLTKVSFSVRLKGNEKPVTVQSVIDGGDVTWSIADGMLTCDLPRLQTWDLIAIELM